MRPLGWSLLVVVATAGALANLAGILWIEIDGANTTWGPWAYVTASWATSALALAIWAPQWRTWPLAAGALCSAGLAIGLSPISEAFVVVLAHGLAALFFAATAWEMRPTRSTKSKSSAPPT